MVVTMAVSGLRTARAEDAIETTVERSGRLLVVRSTFDTAAPATTCYEVLADFDRLAEFVPGLRASRIVSPPGAPLVLHQVGVASAGFVKVTLDLTLDVSADPPRQLQFARRAGNLKQMRGRWTVGGDAGHCTVDYQADIEPAFWVPPLVGPLLMRNQVEKQMEGLVAEMTRRAAGANGTDEP